jgi:hypothetical protein
MGAWKSLTTSDVTVVPFVVNKSFAFIGTSSFVEPEVGIDRLIGTYIPNSIPFREDLDPTTGFVGTYYQRDIYSSIKQLYYTNYIPNPISGSLISYEVDPTSGGFNVVSENHTNTNVYSRFYNYEQTTLSQSRYFPTESGAQIGVISIPSKLFGEYINPRTFEYTFNYSGSEMTTLYDNGEGNILESGSNNNVGIITYQHGLITITSASLLTNFTSSVNTTCSFQSAWTIFETQYRCTLRENEFNYSQNPSVISGSGFTNPLNTTCSIDQRGLVYGFVTGSVFSPYVAAVGLYNEAQELLAVAKLSQPLPTTRTTDMTIVVNLDM